ncbi:MAG: glycosyltransferase [Candidatus Kaistia colombiensis]|nr:MAG: glycosyltransferase [Kaistia sp.]
MAIVGQLTMVAAIPMLTRLYSPADFGTFTIYLSIVNILGAIAALRFEYSLYVVEENAQAHITAKLILLAVATTSTLVLVSGVLLTGGAPERLRHLAYLIPIGMAGAGLVEAMNCWCLRFNHLREFAIGRAILPASMALLQLSFGLAHVGGEAMVQAHILSQAVLIGYLGSRALTWQDVLSTARAPWGAVISTARREHKFLLFDVPATVAGFAIINLPAILIGAMFGTTFAGQFGVAARLVSGPVALIATPLSNVFVAEVSRGRNGPHLIGTARGFLVLAAALIAVPIMGFGLIAPYFVVPLLGENWAVAGQIMAALAIMGAAQALSTPLQEVPTLFRRQEVRLVVDTTRMLLVFAPIVIGAHAGWAPLHVIYLMAAGGAAGFALKTVACLILLSSRGRPATTIATSENSLKFGEIEMEPAARRQPEVVHAPRGRPFISVAIPTFRRPGTIRRAIESVLRQDYADWELVVSDDEGPQGETWSILTEYAQAEPRIRILENHRGQGQIDNTNNAMLACAGSWIKPLHDDDWLAQGSLSAFAKAASANPTAAFLTCATNNVWESGTKLRSSPDGPNRIVLYSSQECLRDLYLVRTTRSLGMVPSTLLVRNDVIHAGCLMRTYRSVRSAVDQLFFIDLACRGNMVVINDGLIFYDATSHPSITQSTSFSQADEETLDLKQLTWSLIEDTKRLPRPETMVRALRVARLRGRLRHQTWAASIRDSAQIIRPSVLMAASQDILARVFGVASRG